MIGIVTRIGPIAAYINGPRRIKKWKHSAEMLYVGGLSEGVRAVGITCKEVVLMESVIEPACIRLNRSTFYQSLITSWIYNTPHQRSFHATSI